MGDRNRERHSRNFNGVVLTEDTHIAYFSHAYCLLFGFCVFEYHTDIPTTEGTNPYRTRYFLFELLKDLLRFFVLVFIVERAYGNRTASRDRSRLGGRVGGNIGPGGLARWLRHVRVLYTLNLLLDGT